MRPQKHEEQLETIYYFLHAIFINKYKAINKTKVAISYELLVSLIFDNSISNVLTNEVSHALVKQAINARKQVCYTVESIITFAFF